MYNLWLVSEDSGLPETLALHLHTLGAVWTGAPEIGQFKDADPPDLVVVGAAPVADDPQAALERLLGFLRGVPGVRRRPPPVLFIESPDRSLPAPVVSRLVDDRLLQTARWPLDPERIVSEAAALLANRDLPTSLRERARREWVTARVDRLYAGLDLPALRHAIAPQNAARPVLLVGEPGTRRGLLARYIHNLAEPARDELIAIPVASLQPSRVESSVLGRCAGRRVTAFLAELDAADVSVQEELAQLLCESGALGIEPIRWIASVTRPEALVPALRVWIWTRVELPPLRSRPDLPEIAHGITAAWSEVQRRRCRLGDDAIEALSSYLWPGNLRELEAVLQSSLARAAGEELRASELLVGAARTSSDAGERESATLAPTPEEETESDAGQEVDAEREVDAEHEGDAEREIASAGRAVREIVAPLAEEIRQPLRAIRTYTNLLDQRPEDEGVRRELSGLVEHDLSHVEATLQRLEHFASLGPPELGPVDLPALVAAELLERHDQTSAQSLVVLKELDHEAPPARADEKQIRFAIGALLDRALRMVPPGGDLYVGSLHRRAGDDGEAAHRLLIRFHSPEDVLIRPADLPGGRAPIEVVLARELVERMGGAFAIDTSGSQDNVVLIELPA